MGKRTKTLDLDMLAYDIADMIDTFEYPIAEHVGDTEIRAALPAFFAALGLGLDGQPLTKPVIDPTGAETPGPMTRHTCNANHPGQPLPYGRKAPEGECARCDELRAGAAPRSAPAWVERQRELSDEHPERAEERRRHFAPGGEHERKCGPISTCFDS